MPAKKKFVARGKRVRRIRPAPSKVAAAPVVAPAAMPTREAAAPERRLSVPRPEFKFGGEGTLFPTDRPVQGSDVQRMKDEAGFDLNITEATLGIAQRQSYYELVGKHAAEPLANFPMAILMRLYERYPKELLPFQPVYWTQYLTQIGVPPTEFAQLVGLQLNAGRVWQRDVVPSRPIQLLIEGFIRAGVTSTDHPVYQNFVKIAGEEAARRGKTLEVKKAKPRRQRRTRELIAAESSLLTPIDD